MKDQKIKIRITENGSIFAETIGIKGKDCLQYIELLEEILDAESIDSNYTEEYFETEIHINQPNHQEIKED